MTLVADIIRRAYRETNLVPLGVDPSAAQEQEGFELLSTVVESVLGNEAGENLNPLPLGTDNIESPAGYPWWSNSLPANVFVRANTRLMLNLTADGYVYFDPAPHDGARMGIVDCAANLDLCPITLYGNGRMIEGQPEIIFNTPNTIREWVYREDLGNWVTVTPLDIAGQMPWPSAFDDMFIVRLALRLNPRNGQVIHPASMDAYKRAETQFSARYGQSKTYMPSENGLIYLTNLQGRNILRENYGDSDALFNTGYPFY